MSMETRQDENEDSSAIFWPGYVDATTNLILNLLFLLMILIIAVFMFALELGSKIKVENPPIVSTKPAEKVLFKSITDPVESISDNPPLASYTEEGKIFPEVDPVKENIELKFEVEQVSKMLVQLVSAKKEGKVAPKAMADYAKQNIELKSELQRLSKIRARLASSKEDVKAVSVATTDHAKENIELKREIEYLNKMLAHQVPQDVKLGDLKKNVDVTLEEAKPLKGLDKIHVSDFEIAVHFKDEAIAFTPEERSRLLETLKPAVKRGRSNIYVEVPAGFSEAKRMGFYRAMAVRNLLIEMNMPKENIDVSVVEGKDKANASRVMVR